MLVKYKAFGTVDWKTLPMTAAATGYDVLVPCADIGSLTGTLKYFVQAFDADNNPVAWSGTRDTPHVVAIRRELQADAPHLPGQPPPAKCEDQGDCPPEFPGCKALGGDKETPCQGDECGPGREPAGDAKKNWVTLAVQQDLLFLSGGQSVCSGEGDYQCFRTTGEFYNRAPYSGSGGAVEGGVGLSTTRILAGYDRAVWRFLLGARLGFAFGGGPTAPEGWSSSPSTPSCAPRISSAPTRSPPPAPASTSPRAAASCRPTARSPSSSTRPSRTTRPTSAQRLDAWRKSGTGFSPSAQASSTPSPPDRPLRRGEGPPASSAPPAPEWAASSDTPLASEAPQEKALHRREEHPLRAPPKRTPADARTPPPRPRALPRPPRRHGPRPGSPAGEDPVVPMKNEHRRRPHRARGLVSCRLPAAPPPPSSPSSRGGPQMTASATGKAGPGDWGFNFSGYFRAPSSSASAQRRARRGPERHHVSPPRRPRQPVSELAIHTGHQALDWAEAYFSYGNNRVRGTIGLLAFNFTDAAWANGAAQFGIGQGYVQINDDLGFKNVRVEVKAGSFWARYGMAGKYDSGKYDTFVFGRTHVMGATAEIEVDIGKLTLWPRRASAASSPTPASTTTPSSPSSSTSTAASATTRSST
ncbi:MAG: hypothetical protein R3F14_02150 [Polyangiaceae bacterium]